MFYVGAAEAAPRSIPWDCSDWQESPAVADAADARVSMILESLAANRGKSIYCAIDQSDTWTKAETWAAGRDRNERDDTVYFGQSGNFRGFLAAQEGYLTDGESGVTGVSRDLIFEFPREERRRRTIIKRLRLEPSADKDQMVWSEWGGTTNYVAAGSRVLAAQHRFTSPGTNHDRNPYFDESIPNDRYGWPHARLSNWPALLREQGKARCRALGYQRGVNPEMSFTEPGTGNPWIATKNDIDSNPLPGDNVIGLAWPTMNSLSEIRVSGATADGEAAANLRRTAAARQHHYAFLNPDDGSDSWWGWARQSYPYSVTCIKIIRKRR